jgi:hypothetical protein
VSALFTPEQEAEIARIAEIRAAAMVGQALHGAAERIASALMDGPVVLLPLLHMTDIAAQRPGTSSGKEAHVSGAVQS